MVEKTADIMVGVAKKFFEIPELKTRWDELVAEVESRMALFHEDAVLPERVLYAASFYAAVKRGRQIAGETE